MAKKKSRFHRYRHVITVFGALLVFATYVVKDAIRDEIKDTVESLQAADYQFFATSENRAIFDLVKTIALVLKDEATKKHKGSETVGEAAAPIVAKVADDLMAAESLKMLIEKLPDDETGLRQLNDDLQKRRNSMFDTLQQITPEIQKRASTPIDDLPDEDAVSESDKRAYEMGDQLEKLEDEGAALELDLAKGAKQAVKRSREIRTSEEQRLRRYTHISYFLYGVGWSLALFGRLVGIEGVEME
jgi:hypothetical protein